MERSKPKIKITGHANRADYHKKYNEAYRLKFKEYFQKYGKKHREEFRQNSTRHLLKLKHGAFWLQFKDEIREIDQQLQELKQKNKELKQKNKVLLNSINQKLKTYNGRNQKDESGN